MIIYSKSRSGRLVALQKYQPNLLKHGYRTRKAVNYSSKQSSKNSVFRLHRHNQSMIICTRTAWPKLTMDVEGQRREDSDAGHHGAPEGKLEGAAEGRSATAGSFMLPCLPDPCCSPSALPSMLPLPPATSCATHEPPRRGLRSRDPPRPGRRRSTTHSGKDRILGGGRN